VTNGPAIPPVAAASPVQRVLLLGPDDDARRTLHLLLDRRGMAVAAMTELDAARRYLAATGCDAVIAPRALAAALVHGVGRGEVPPVIAVVPPRDLEASLAALDAGADEVIADPPDELAIAVALRRLATAPRRVPHTTGSAGPAPALIGDGAAMQQVRATIARLATNRSTVLISGESGTGKELVARALHDASPRRLARFVAINCAAIPEALLESELFGHRRGAFTDAVRDKVGLFEDADGGTLFLDEVGELPLGMQAKLLRVLQESEIRRVGDTSAIKIDVRLIAATLRDLTAEIAAGRFREDLYYRLNVLPLVLPPLRERREDIPALARAFATRHGARHQREVTITDDALALLGAQPWPGNVRELENTIERALVLVDGDQIDAAFLGSVMRVAVAAPVAAPAEDDELSIKKATRTLEQGLIRRALGATSGNRTNAAKLLEISHRALLYKMKEYGIS
jgi:two-component system response regulator AtoC